MSALHALEAKCVPSSKYCLFSIDKSTGLHLRLLLLGVFLYFY